MDHPITIGEVLVVLLISIGGIAGAIIIVRVLSGYVKGMRR